MRIGYIGLGAMGGALARHLIDKYDLTVFDLNLDVMKAFEVLGAKAAASSVELGRNCDLVFLCLPRSSDVQQVLFGENSIADELAPGTIVIDQTSGDPRQTSHIAARLAERDITMIDAPVSGAMATAIAGTISVIASGPPAAFEKARSVLTSISPNVYYVGERVGNGQTLKTVNNMMNVCCRLVTLEMVAMGKKLGLSLDAMTEAINSTSAANYTSQRMLPAISEGRQSTKFALALQMKDVNQAISIGAESDDSMPISRTARGLIQIGLNTLGENPQIEDLIRLTETLTGTKFVDPILCGKE